MKNITVKQFSEKPDIRYTALLSSLVPNNLFAGKQSNIGRLPYLDVIAWYEKITKIKDLHGMCDLFTFIFDIEEVEFWNASIVDYFSAKNFIEQDFKTRQESEAKLLSGGSVDKLKWEAAGGNSLRAFSKTSPLDDLAKRYGGYPFDYGRKPYNDILHLITMSIRKNIVANNYQKLLNEK